MGTPQFTKGLVNADFAIVIKEIRGDRDLGNSIKSNLNRYRITDGKKYSM